MIRPDSFLSEAGGLWRARSYLRLSRERLSRNRQMRFGRAPAHYYSALKPFAARECFYCLLQTLMLRFFFLGGDYPPTDLLPIRWRLRLNEAPGCFVFL